MFKAATSESTHRKSINEINEINEGNKNPLSPLLYKVSDIECGDIAFHRNEPQDLIGRAKTWMFPPATQAIDISDIKSSGRQLMRAAEQQAAHNESRGRFEFRPVMKKAAVLVGSAIAGAALGTYAYSRYSAAPAGTDVAPASDYDGPQADALIVGQNFFPLKKSEGADTSGRKQSATTTPAPIPDDVKIEKLYDFSCLDVRNNMHFTDNLRAIGKALASPVDSLAKESQVIHYMNTNHKSCPPKSDVDDLEWWTKKIDKIISSIMWLVPGFKPIMILQSLIGPLMERAADDLEGKPVNLDLQNEIFSNFLMLAQDAVKSTLKPEERVEMYSNEPIKDPAKKMSIIEKRFKFKDGKGQVTVDGSDYEIKHTPIEGMPYIEDEEGNHYFIKWNQDTEKWEKVEDSVFHENSQHYEEYKNNLEKAEKFGIDLSKEPPGWKVEMLRDGKEHEFFSLERPGKEAIKGVFVLDKFIPADQLKVGAKWVTSTWSSGGVRAVLEDSVYGWRFEQKSVPTDKYLDFLLNSPVIPKGEVFTSGFPFTSIDGDGVCHDVHGEVYLKKDDKYYWMVSERGYYRMHSSPTSEIVYREGLFTLRKDENVLFPHGPIRVGKKYWSSDFMEAYIEPEARDFLLKYGDGSSTGAFQNVYVLDGVYNAFEVGEKVLVLDDNCFFINKRGNENGHDWLDIRTAKKPQTTFRLKKIANIYIRERDEKFSEKFEYTPVSLCRAKRAPGMGACSQPLPVLFEKNFEDKLSSFIAAGKSSNKDVLNQHLTEESIYEGALIYKDDQSTKHYHMDLKQYGRIMYDTSIKNYMLYKGHFFYTEIIEPKDKSNHIGKTLFKVYGKGNFLAKKEYIETVIIDKQGDKIQVKPQSVYLAEQVNVTDEMAQSYIKSRDYVFVGGMNEVEDAISNVVASGKFYFGKVPRKYAVDYPDSAIDSRVKRMYPSRLFITDDYRIKIFKLTDDVSGLSNYQREAVAHIKSIVEVIKDFIFPTLVRSIKFHSETEGWGACRQYLNELLNFPPSEKLLDDVGLYIRKMIRNMDAAFDKKNIFLTMVEAKESSSISPDFYDSDGLILTDEEKSSGQLAFAANDRFNRIYINLDKTYAKPGSDFLPKADIFSVIIHELSHMQDMTIDTLYLPREADGMYIPAKDAVEHIIAKIHTFDLEKKDEFLTRSKEYLKNIPLYKPRINNLHENGREQFALLAEGDPGFLAHTLLNCADCVSMMIMDLYEAVTRGINDMRPANSLTHILEGTIIARDKFGTYYDKGDGWIVKEYDTNSRSPAGTLIEVNKDKFMSRADLAITNAKALDRMYGENTASILINDINHAASTKFKKIPGEALPIMLENIAHRRDVDYKSHIEAIINGKDNPADVLVDKLVDKKIIVHAADPTNLLFDKDTGFSIFNYDDADLWPLDGNIPQSEIDAMRQRIRTSVAWFAFNCGMSAEDVVNKIGLVTAQNPVPHKLKGANAFLRPKETIASPEATPVPGRTVVRELFTPHKKTTTVRPAPISKTTRIPNAREHIDDSILGHARREDQHNIDGIYFER